jgi:ribosomal protein S18 acetylase RimI-like enzyme
MLNQTELTEKYAKEISTWKYDTPYSVYNYPDWDKISEQKWAITIADKRKEEFKAVTIEIDGKLQLFGVFRFKTNDQIVMLGLGLNPQFCGRGYGKQLMGLIIQEFEQRFNDKVLELEVRTFNKRAVKCYIKAGFFKVHSYIKETPNGIDTFILMRYNKICL